MKHYKSLVTVILTTSLAIATLNVSAAPWNKRKFNRADENNNGRIGPREFGHEKRREHRHKSIVDKPWERKADTNNNGYVGIKEKDQARGKRYLNKRSDVDREWEYGADTNQDGNISKEELENHYVAKIDKDGNGRVEKKERRNFAVKRKSKVNTKRERKYDANSDGYINRTEAKEMLKDRLRVINTHGRAQVNTDIEREFDSNGDGIIDRNEAQSIQDSL